MRCLAPLCFGWRRIWRMSIRITLRCRYGSIGRDNSPKHYQENGCQRGKAVGVISIVGRWRGGIPLWSHSRVMDFDVSIIVGIACWLCI